MKFYCSSIHPPPPSLSLFSFLLARFPPRANLVTRIHSKRNYPMQRKLQVYVCIRVAGTEGRGPIGCAGLSKTSNNKTFLRFPKPIRHRRHHLPHSTYQSRRRSTISIPPSIANRLHSRNLNSQLLQFFRPPLPNVRDLWILGDRHLRPPLESGRRVSSVYSSVQPGQSASIIDVEAEEERGEEGREREREKKADRDYRTLDEWSYSAVGISGGHCLSINH